MLQFPIVCATWWYPAMKTAQRPGDIRLFGRTADLHLPQVPRNVTWSELNLPARTHRIFSAAFANPQHLDRITVGELSRIRGFGRQNLYDLLHAIRTCRLPKLPPSREHSREEQHLRQHLVVSHNELTCPLSRCATNVGEKYLPAPPPGTSFGDLACRTTGRLLMNARASGFVSQPGDLRRLQVIHALILSSGKLYEVAELVRKIEGLIAAEADHAETTPRRCS